VIAKVVDELLLAVFREKLKPDLPAHGRPFEMEDFGERRCVLLPEMTPPLHDLFDDRVIVFSLQNNEFVVLFELRLGVFGRDLTVFLLCLLLMLVHSGELLLVLFCWVGDPASIPKVSRRFFLRLG
jgi:hypothetical protein